ncbi:MAG: tyrosine-type recombinase/integrase [Myxococcaceae bacterium]
MKRWRDPDGHWRSRAHPAPGNAIVLADCDLSIELARPDARTPRLLEAFLESLSEDTRRAYAADLRDFAAFIGASDPVAAAERLFAQGHGEANALVFEYRLHLTKRGMRPASINRHIASIGSLVNAARITGRISWTLEVPRLKTRSYRDTRGPGRSGFLALLAKLAGRTDAKSVRDRAIVRLMFERALRVSEVRGIDLADLDFERDRISILGKGRTEKEFVTLAPPTIAALREWLAIRGTAPGPVFCTLRSYRGVRAGHRLTRMALYKVVRKLGEAIGIRARPHGLRHAAITDALDHGQSIRSVQRFARHLSLQTLLIYDDNRSDLGGDVARAIAEPDSPVTSPVTSGEEGKKKGG